MSQKYEKITTKRKSINKKNFPSHEQISISELMCALRMTCGQKFIKTKGIRNTKQLLNHNLESSATIVINIFGLFDS